MPSPRYARAWSTMLRELSQGQFDGPATTAGVRGSALACLQRAIAWAASGDPARAREDVDRALDHACAAPVQAAAGLILQLTGDFARGLDLLEAADPGLGHTASELALRRAALADRLGWMERATRALADAARHAPDDPRLRREYARVLAEAGDTASALEQLERSLVIEPSDGPTAVLHARLAKQLGQADQAVAAVSRPCVASDPEALVDGALILIELERFADAAALLDSGSFPHTRVLALRAELARWQGDAERARRCYEDARALDEAAPEVLRLEAKYASEQGAAEQAERAIQDAAAHPDADVAVHLDHAELQLRRGRAPAAHEALNAAANLGDPEHPVIRALRERVNLEELEHGEPVDLRRLREHLPLFRAGHDRPDYDFDDDITQEEAKDAFDALLRRIVWRGATPIGHRQGRPCVLWRPAYPSFVELVRQLPRMPRANRVDAIDRFLAAHPDHADGHCLRAELALRTNDLERARAALERARLLSPDSTRARLVFACIALATGDLERALESARGPVDSHDTAAAGLSCVRGEVFEQRGALERARTEFHAALKRDSGLVAAWLALARLELGPDPARAAEIHGWLATRCPALLSDACRSIGVPPERRDLKTLSLVLERAHASLGGFRASRWVTYVDPEGALRSVPEIAGTDATADARAKKTLELAQSVVLEATQMRHRLTPLRVSPTVPPPPPMPSVDDTSSIQIAEPNVQTLDDADVRHFVDHGFVRLRACFDRQAAASIVAEANAKISTDPARWVGGYTERDAALRSYRPDHPETWVRSQLDLNGGRAYVLSEFAPELWAAICQLVGGQHRVATRTWHDYFSVNLRDRAEEGPTVPALDWRGWHVDDPSSRARLDEFTNALLLVMLFSDVESGGGATFIVPESVGIVANRLAAQPAGVDLRDPAFGPSVASQCSRRVELTGSIGDVFLCHAFMVHSASPNASGRIRWMSNPMIRATEWLDYRGDTEAGSPVERVVRKALASR